MQTAPLASSFGLAFRSISENLKAFLTVGAVYASMNLVIQLPALMMDVAGIFDDMFRGGFPLGLQFMSGEQQAATMVQSGIVIVSALVNSILWMGALQLSLSVVDGKKADIWDAVLDLELVPVAVLIGFVGLLIAPAYMCCFVPGLILGACVYQWPLAALDPSSSPMDSLSVSVDLFRREMLPVTAMVAILNVIPLVGSLFMFVPSVFLFPFIALTAAHMYRLRVPRIVEE